MDDLFDWVSKRPDWQQDALHRLTQQKELSESDVTDLCQWIGQSNGLPVAPRGTLRRIQRDDLRKETAQAPKTILGSIGPVTNVERLAPNQGPLSFAVDGITLVYGPNGSGKSGYCRIAKNLCRSLHDAPLKQNVFASNASAAPEVRVCFQVAGEANKKEVIWKQPESPPPELNRISVFDSHAAGLYVDSDRNVEFLPSDLDLLSRLAISMGKLDEQFKAREQMLQAALSAPLSSAYSRDSEVATTLGKLFSRKPGEALLSEAELIALAAWDGKNEERLKALSTELQSDPATLARTFRQLKSTIDSLTSELNSLATTLGDDAIAHLTASHKDALDKRILANASAVERFSGEPIKNVGSDSWLQMLGYARAFVAELFPDETVIRLNKNDRCVLCQQELTAIARDRLDRFDTYIQDQANRDAKKAERTFIDLTDGLKSIRIRPTAEVSALLTAFAALGADKAKIAESIEQFFNASQKRIAEVVGLIGAKKLELKSLESLPILPSPTLLKESAWLDQAAATCEAQARKDTKRDKLRLEYANLADRQRLASEIGLFLDRRAKLEALDKISRCRSACVTTGVTQQITKLRKEVLTPSLQKNLRDEIDAFDLGHLPIRVDDWGSYGESKVQIKSCFTSETPEQRDSQ